MDALLEAQTEARGPAGQWIEDNLVRVSGSRLFTSQVWSAAQSTSGNEGDTVWGLTRRSFSRMVTSVLSLKRVKVLRIGDRRERGWEGVGWASDSPVVPGAEAPSPDDCGGVAWWSDESA